MNQSPGYDVPAKKVVSRKYFRIFLAIALVSLVVSSYAFITQEKGPKTRVEDLTIANKESAQAKKDTVIDRPVGLLTALDTAKYQLQLEHMTNGDSSGKWPVKRLFPLPGQYFL